MLLFPSLGNISHQILKNEDRYYFPKILFFLSPKRPNPTRYEILSQVAKNINFSVGYNCLRMVFVQRSVFSDISQKERMRCIFSGFLI